MSAALERELRAIVGDAGVAESADRTWGRDATEAEGLTGAPAAVVLPANAAQAAAVVAWCYEHDAPIVPRGGGTGFAGGCVPVLGGVVVAMQRLSRVLALEPELWRMHVEAGLTTAHVRRLASEHGLMFPPDPGAAEQSQIGGNIATNAGGPHAFKYGVTASWVTGLQAVVAPGELVTLGGVVRKDVAAYDLMHLLAGSEGTLALVTSAWLRLAPRPQAAIPVVATYADAAAGCDALLAVLGSGIVPAAVEFLDAGALDAAREAYPHELPAAARFMLIAEADGSHAEAAAVAGELTDALRPQALALERLEERAATAALWRWRDGVSIAVQARRGGKVSEDIVVPPERLLDAVEATLAIGNEHDLDACSWGHAGDGNLHSTFLVDPRDEEEVRRAHGAAAKLYEVALRLGGSISGEHGIGWVKRGHLHAQLDPVAARLQESLKRTLDPKGLFNPGKKL